MKVVGFFELPDGSESPDFTAQQIKNGETEKYGVSKDEIVRKIFNYAKLGVEYKYSQFKVSI